LNCAYAQPSIESLGITVQEEWVKINWQVDCNFSESPSAVLVRYNKATVLAGEGDIWIYTEPVSYRDGFIKLEDLNSTSTYIFQIGYQTTEGKYVWGPRNRFDTKTPWGLIRFLLMIGALCLFIYGMKTMTEGIQASAGNKLRKALGYMTRNRFAGILSGFLITGVLQSSSATTVMTIGFVNAGLISLTQSVGVIMGANIGTTVTGWIVSMVGYRFNITLYSLILFAVATPLLLVKKPEVKSWSTAIIGFAMLFMGLGFLKDTVPDLTEDSPFVQFFVRYSDIPVAGMMLFVLLGAVIAVIVQSSSSAITLTMALCANGVIPLDVAAAMVLGENIGTCATAEIAALVANVHAKRSARVHTLFNVLGTLWMVMLLPYFLEFIGKFLSADPYSDTDSGKQAATTALAAFHTTFNVVNTLFFVWLVPQLIKLATFTVPSKGSDDEIFRLEYLGSPIKLSELSIIEAKGELIKFGEIVMRMSAAVRKMLTETDPEERVELHTRVRKYEKITDRLEIEISHYSSRMSTSELSAAASEKVRAMLSISNDLERVGDILYQMSATIERKNAAKIWFTQDQREKLNEMFDLVDNGLQVMLLNMHKAEGEPIEMDKAKSAEKALNQFRNDLRKEYISKVESGTYNLRSASIYSDLFSSLEKVGDHVINVSEALNGEV
jgi:phosphate:Na+ symporter